MAAIVAGLAATIEPLPPGARVSLTAVAVAVDAAPSGATWMPRPW
jgi:hypothetical protein